MRGLVQVAALSWLVVAALVALERAGEETAGQPGRCCDDECSPMPLRCPVAGPTEPAHCGRPIQLGAGLLSPPSQAVPSPPALAAEPAAAGAPGADHAPARLVAPVAVAPRAPPSVPS